MAPGLDVVHENRVLGGVEDRAVACLRHPQRLVGALALRDVLLQPRLRVGDLQRHRVERAAQPAELVGALAGRCAPTRLPAASSSAARTSRAVRRVSRKWNTSHIASASAVTQPAQYSDCCTHLRARFRLVALEVVGEEQAAGAGRAQLVALAAHQDAGVAEQRVAVRVDRHAGATLANRAGRLLEIELRQHVGDRSSEPRAPRRGDDHAGGRRSARRG